MSISNPSFKLLNTTHWHLKPPTHLNLFNTLHFRVNLHKHYNTLYANVIYSQLQQVFGHFDQHKALIIQITQKFGKSKCDYRTICNYHTTNIRSCNKMIKRSGMKRKKRNHNTPPLISTIAPSFVVSPYL